MLKSEGIVIKEIRYKDTSKILTIYTKEYGKISAMARGAYKPKSQLISTTQPFAYSEYQFNRSRNFLYINQGDIIDSFYSIRDRMERVIYGYYILELVDKSLAEEQENEKIFLLLEKGLRVLSKLDKDFLKFIIAYELKFISFLGYKPSIDKCVNCNSPISANIKFSIGQGGILCRSCFNFDLFAIYLDRETYEVMYQLLYIPLEKTDQIKASQESIEKLHGIILKYILTNIDRKKFNSLKLIDELGKA